MSMFPGTSNEFFGLDIGSTAVRFPAELYPAPLAYSHRSHTQPKG